VFNFESDLLQPINQRAFYKRSIAHALLSYFTSVADLRPIKPELPSSHDILDVTLWAIVHFPRALRHPKAIWLS